jgi:hypothetical protein
VLGLLALIARAEAADVLLVDATPVTLDDFSVAGMLTDMVADAVRDEGLDLDDPEAVRSWAHTDADTCWDVDACPANLWDRTGARLAVVMSVGREGGGLAVAVRLHGADDAAPFKVIRQVVPPGGEAAFAKSVARAAKDALPLLPARKAPGPVFVMEDELVPETIDEDAENAALRDLDAPDDARSTDTPAHTDATGRASPTHDAASRDGHAGRDGSSRDSTGRDSTSLDRSSGSTARSHGTKAFRDALPEGVAGARLRADEERKRMGVPATAYGRYEESGLSREAWLAKARVRAGHAFLELAGGWGLGDVDRGYGVRLRIADSDEEVFDTLATSSWEGPGAGAAPTFGFAVGYAPAWYLDTSVALSVQYGQKHLDTGWECLDLPCSPDSPAKEYTHDPVAAIQALVEPRLRLYPVAIGPVKPYALVAFTLMLHDGYQVPDPDFVDYPDTQAGATFGPTVGLGLAVDPVSRISLFAEVPGTWLASPGVRTVADGEVTLDPTILPSSGFVVRFVGGVAVRL